MYKILLKIWFKITKVPKKVSILKKCRQNWFKPLSDEDNEIDLPVTLCGILQFQEKYPMDGSMDSFGTARTVFWDIRAKTLFPNSWGIFFFLFALGQSVCHTSTHSGRFRKLFFFKCSNLHWRTPVLVTGLHFSLAFDHLIKLCSEIFYERNVSNICAAKDMEIYS